MHTTRVINATTTLAPTSSLIVNPDTGSSGHYITVHDSIHLDDVQPTQDPVSVQLPDGTVCQSTHTGYLRLPHLTTTARLAHVLPGFTGSLLSIGQLCDAGYTAVYTAVDVTIVDDTNKPVMRGLRSTATGLWTLVLNGATVPRAAPHSIAAATTLLPSTTARLVDFYFKAIGAPPVSTLVSALTSGILALPGLTARMVTSNPPDLPATAKGHLDRLRQGVYSSHRRTASAAVATELVHDAEDPIPVYTTASDINVTVQVVAASDIRGTTHGDLTGRFPVTSNLGFQYTMVVLHEELNYIHAEPMRNRTKSEYLRAFKASVDFFKLRGIPVSAHRLDNESSGDLVAYCRQPDVNIALQFVPPDCHRANRAERAIRTWKNHVITNLCLVDPRFPLDAWDRIIGQLELTLNLVRKCGLNPTLSAWSYLHGPYDFTVTPIAPVGTKVVVFEDPRTRPTWATHGIDAWYVGPALNHFHEFTVYVPSTKACRTTNTLSWFPHDTWPIPGTSQLDDITVLVDALITAVSSLTASSIPSCTPAATTAATTALATLRTLFNTDALPIPPLPTPFPVIVPASVPPVPESAPTLNTDAPPQRVLVPESLPTTPDAPVTAPALAVPAVAPATRKRKPRVPRPVKPPSRQSMRRRVRSLKYASVACARPTQSLVHSAFTSVDLDATGAVLTYRTATKGPDKVLWEEAHDAEFERLIDTWHCITLCPHTELPADRLASYYNPQVKTKIVNGKLTYRVRGTYGGNRTDYTGDVTAHTADLSTIKCHLNSTLSTPGARYMTADIKDYYLGTPLDRPEYMWIPLHMFPPATLAKYNVASLAHNGRVLARVDKGIYGLPQAGLLAQKRLIAHLAKNGYHQAKHTPCLFQHESRPVSAVLVVDDFGVKYVGRQHAEHLMAVLNELYTMKEDWDASKYIGYSLKWNYTSTTPSVELSMPGYVAKALKRFGVTAAPPTHAPLPYTPPKYGASAQLTTTDDSVMATKEEKLWLQEFVGVFLYHARALDLMSLCAVNKIASAQANPTQHTLSLARHYLNYIATWPEPTVVHWASDMVLTVDTDASYLSESNARSRAGGLVYFGDASSGLLNGPVHHTSVIIPTVVASAAEAEYAALFILLKDTTPLRQAAIDMGHPQPPTPVTCDNTCAVGLANNTCKQRRSKAIDMRYHWVRDRIGVGDFAVRWRSNRFSLADYLTKCHPARHCLYMRQFYYQSTAALQQRLHLRRPLPARRHINDVNPPALAAKTPKASGRKGN